MPMSHPGLRRPIARPPAAPPLPDTRTQEDKQRRWFPFSGTIRAMEVALGEDAVTLPDAICTFSHLDAAGVRVVFGAGDLRSSVVEALRAAMSGGYGYDIDAGTARRTVEEMAVRGLRISVPGN